MSDLRVTAAELAGCNRRTTRTPTIWGGLVDECQLFVWPRSSAAANRPRRRASAPTSSVLDEHRFNNGVVRLVYRIPS